MAEEWAGVVNAVTSKFLKGAADLTTRRRLFLAMLRKRGRITMGHDGISVTWDVEFMQPPVEAYGDGGLVTYARHDIYRMLSVDWRGYYASDLMTAKEKEMAKGNSALVKRYSAIAPNLEKSIRDKMSTELYIDGYATGNQNRLHGLATFMDTTATCVVGDRIQVPTKTNYAGKSCVLGAESGSWSANLTGSDIPNAALANDWPEGSGTSDYDYLAPKQLNWSSTAWTGTNTFFSTSVRCMRQGLLWLTLTAGDEGRPSLILMPGKMYADFLNNQSSNQRIIVPHKESQDLGFGETVNFDGAGIQYEFGCPGNNFFMLNLDQCELRCLYSDLFMPHGPDYDPRTFSWLYAIGFFGNMTFQPKFFGKGQNYAAS